MIYSLFLRYFSALFSINLSASSYLFLASVLKPSKRSNREPQLVLNKAQFAGNAYALSRTATRWSANWGSPEGRTAKRSCPLLRLPGVFQYACEDAPGGRTLGDSLFERFEGFSTPDLKTIRLGDFNASTASAWMKVDERCIWVAGAISLKALSF